MDECSPLIANLLNKSATTMAPASRICGNDSSVSSDHTDDDDMLEACNGSVGFQALSPIPERKEAQEWDNPHLFHPDDDGDLHHHHPYELSDHHEGHGIGHPLFVRTRTRSLSIENIVLDTLDVISDVKEVVVEGISEVQEVIHEEILPVCPREKALVREKLSALALAIIVFYKVSGGPFGCEPTIRAAGPFYSLLGFIIFPLLWSLPEALVTAELGTAYPEPSGAVAWIEEAFGPKAGLLCGYFHWVSGATDNAIYPSLFLEYVSSFIYGGAAAASMDADSDAEHSILANHYVRFAFTVAITAALAFTTFTGLEVVGNVSIIVSIISMSPFILLIIFGLPHVDPARWLTLPASGIIVSDDDVPIGATFFPAVTFAGIAWRPFVNNLFWNLNSFDVGASFAGEVQNPDVVFPKAMMMSVVFVVLAYLLPLLVALGVSDTPQESWKAGHLTVVAKEVGGEWLASWTVIGAAVSCIALFLAEMSGDAWQLLGMADRGLIPKFFCRRSRFDTPTNGILLGTLVIFCLSVAKFDALVEMLNFSFSVALLMEYAAFVKLRITHRDLRRPFRLPFGTVGCVLLVLPSCCIAIFVMMVASKMTYLYVLVMVLFGAFFHFLQKTAKHYDWWQYAEAKRNTSTSSLTGLYVNGNGTAEN
ncbi:Amino acid permease [Fragilaria crotonensis]|nr:Amino acid permease [Fragilaria crotonensis]